MTDYLPLLCFLFVLLFYIMNEVRSYRILNSVLKAYKDNTKLTLETAVVLWTNYTEALQSTLAHLDHSHGLTVQEEPPEEPDEEDDLFPDVS